MKLAEIKGERALDVIAEIMEPIGNIATDKNSANIIAQLKNKETRFEALKGNLPSLIKNHKKDLITILALLDNVSYKKYKEKMSLFSLTKDLFSLVSDEVFDELFTSAQTPMQDESYGDVQVTSKDEA